MITLKSKGDFSKTERYLKGVREKVKMEDLDSFGREGVAALSSATPYKTGSTANAWRYEIERENSKVSLNFFNDNVNKGVNIAIILQYGHGTGTGGWVEGIDYINPAIKPVFDSILNRMEERLRGV